MIKRFNEMFDDEEMRDKLEIPYLQGEFTLGNPNLKRFSKPSNMITKETELKKILYKFPVLETFHKKSKTINGSSVSAFYATSMKPIKGEEFYVQLAFAFDKGEYHINVIYRNLFEYENEENWVVRDFKLDNLNDTFDIVEYFLKGSIQLGVMENIDLYSPTINN